VATKTRLNPPLHQPLPELSLRGIGVPPAQSGQAERLDQFVEIIHLSQPAPDRHGPQHTDLNPLGFWIGVG
jgi:hypothetical protein